MATEAQVAANEQELDRVATRITQIDAERSKLIVRRDDLIRKVYRTGLRSQTQVARVAQITKANVGFIVAPIARRRELSRNRTQRAADARTAARRQVVRSSTPVG